MNDITKKQITIGFNITMFIYICISFLADYLFGPENPAKAPWEVLFGNSPILSMVLALIFALVLIIAGAYLLRIFWNRFIADVFNLRVITYQEAIALLFIAVVVFR